MTKLERDIQATLSLLDATEGDGSVLVSERVDAESLLSAIGLSVEPIAPSASVRARLLDATRVGTRFEGVLARVSQLLDFSADQSRTLLERIADSAADLVGWVDGDIAGAHYFHFDGGPRVANADCGLVRLEPGVNFPAHRHLGSEISLVLSGRAIEGTGVVFEPGDLVVREPGTTHDFSAVGDEPFVFVVVLGGGIEIV